VHQIDHTQISLTNEPSSALTDKNRLKRTNLSRNGSFSYVYVQLHKVSREQLPSRGNINVKLFNFTMCEERMNAETTVASHQAEMNLYKLIGILSLELRLHRSGLMNCN